MEANLVESLLAPKLPVYREWRERWPLWTGDRAAWAGEEWVDGIHWSLWLQLSEIGIGLRSALPSEYTLTNPLTDSLYYMALRRGGGHPGSIRHPLPALYHLRVLAAAAQFAEVMPDEIAGIAVPKLGRRGIPETEAEGRAREFGRLLPEILGRFARFHQGTAGDGMQTEAEMALQLTRELGLSVKRPANTKVSISSAVLGNLRRELREIVAAVRDYRVPEDDLLAMERLVTNDPQLSIVATHDAGTWMRLVESKAENLRERGLRMGRGSWVEAEVRQLQFPFLLRGEIKSCVNGKKTANSVADDLLAVRLPGKISPSTLASKLSRST